MRVKNFLVTKVSLYCKARDFCLGKGVTMYTDEISNPMVLFLVEKYEYYEQNNRSCLIGDIGSLYKRKKEIDQKRIDDNTTYRKHLQEQIEKGYVSLPKGNE